MIDLDYEALQQLADAATPGPWCQWDDGDVGTDYPVTRKRRKTGDEYTVESMHIANADAHNGAFIAEARSAVPALLTRVRELEAESRQMEAELKDLLRVDLPSRVAERDAALKNIKTLNEVLKIHSVQHGERPVYAKGDYSSARRPVSWEPYQICRGCSADYPCATVRAIDTESR